MKNLNFTLLDEQTRFCFDTEHGEQGMTGGFRAGKSWVGVHKAIFLSALHRGKKGALLSPTYGMTKRNLIPIFKKVNEQYKLGIQGLHVKNPDVLRINWGGKISEIHLDISAEFYDRLNGVTLAWSGLDEADKCSSMETAENCWFQMASRLSDPAPGERGIQFATSTPEGFGFMYHTFDPSLPENINNTDKKLYRMSMLDNYMLDPTYIAAQRRKIPAYLFKSYILGEFANVYSNLVYKSYDRSLNDTQLTLQDIKDDEILHVGMDFNANGMSAVGFLVRIEEINGVKENVAHFVYESIGSTNTPALIKIIKKDLVDKNIKFVVYPDPSCIQDRSETPDTNFILLKRAQFRIMKMNIAPDIIDRVNSVNARFCNELDVRRCKVNLRKCPLLSKALSLQIFTPDGLPKKKDKLPGTTHTHIDGPLDAGGYALYSKWPLLTTNSRRPVLQGF